MNYSNSYIETYTGVFEPLIPTQYPVSITDIAHALSQICRFTGHCKYFYSVAQHSLNVAKLIENDGYDKSIQLEGLLHDGSEAYICDVARPIKPSLKNYAELEENIQNEINKTFNIKTTNKSHDIVKLYDNIMLHEEALRLMHNKTKWANHIVESWKELPINLYFTEMELVEKEFIKKFNSLI